MNRTIRDNFYPSLRRFIVVSLVVSIASLGACAQLKSVKPDEWGFRVVAKYPHDPSAFTQGLEFYQGKLYEGTGKIGASSIRRVVYKTGEIEKIVRLPSPFFGEGITIFKDKLYQLTWQNRVCVVYSINNMEQLQTFNYAGEGWGLTHNGQSLIMSNGSSILQFINPETFAVERQISAHQGDKKIQSLNELEYVEGEIWANVWLEDRIVRVSPEDGRVLGWINLKGLYPRPQSAQDQVLNGIAYDSDSKRLLVTGKNWPHLFEITLLKNSSRK